MSEQQQEPADERTPLQRLHAAVQAFSNDLSDEDDDVGMVTAALVVWEETSYADDGQVVRTLLYAATGDGATPAHSLGLATYGLARVQAAVVGCACEGS